MTAINRRNNAICSNMDRPRNYHVEVKLTRQSQISYDIVYMRNLKKKKKKNEKQILNIRNRNRSTDIEKKLMVTKRERLGEG